MAKQKVLLVVDVKNWAFDHIARSLVTFSSAFDYTIIYHNDLKITKYETFDIIHFFHWSLYYHWKKGGFTKQPRQIITLGIHGFHNSPEELEYLGEVDSVSVICKSLEDHINSYEKKVPVYYCPDGVDTAFFRKKRAILRQNTINIGWTGNSAWGWDNKDTKGLYTIIKPALEGVANRVKLHIADRNIKWRTPAEMVEWYNDMDVIICASSCEGTPLPLLEASACGRAVLTTRVGIVPEFYNGLNCIIFDRNKEALREAIENLSRESIAQVAENAFKSVRSWSRKDLVKNYEKMWNQVTRRFINITASSVLNN